jgi:hypothetical protein
MRLSSQPWHGHARGRGPGRFFVAFLAAMFAEDYITEAQYQTAINTPVNSSFVTI